MTDRLLRVALLGYGLAGRWFHGPLLRTTPRIEVAAVVTADPQRRAQAAAELPQARLIDRADDLWADPDGVDLAVIATANVAHVAQATAALRAGLHVVVDKPVAGSLAELDGLLAEAEQAARQLMVFQNRRWDSDFLTVRRLIEVGEIGAVHRWESRFERWRPEAGGGWREESDPAQVGGVLFDLGAHLIDQAILVLGRPVSVYAERRRIRPGAGADDDAFVAVQHVGGAVSHHWMSAVAAQQGPRLRVLGATGALTVDGLDPQEAALRAGGLPNGDWGQDDRVVRRDGAGEATALPMDPGRWPEFYGQVAAALLDGAAPPVPAAQVRDPLAVLCAAVQSAAAGGVVAIG